MTGSDPTAFAELENIHFLSLLTVDGRKWLLPQSETRLLGALVDIDPDVRAPFSVGAVGFSDEWWPIYCLSGDMQFMPRLTASRRICLLLSNGADNFGIVCDQIESFNRRTPYHPLPACMRSDRSPIQALIALENGIGCVTTTERLAAYIAGFVEEAENA